jgi:hypothetical protein
MLSPGVQNRESITSVKQSGASAATAAGKKTEHQDDPWHERMADDGHLGDPGRAISRPDVYKKLEYSQCGRIILHPATL